MSLDDLNKELYRENSEVISSRAHEKSEYDPKLSGNAPSPFDRDQQWERAKKQMDPYQKRKVVIALSILGLVVLFVGGSMLWRWWQVNAFHPDSVLVSIEGPKETDSTALTKYIVHYKNDNRVTLKAAYIQLNYSENFQPFDNLNLKTISPSSSKIFVGDIGSKSEGSITFQGTFYAPKDSPVYLHADLHYTPSNGASELAMQSQMSVNITSAPVLLEVTAPAQAIDGDKVEYVIDYKNLDIRRMSDIKIKVDLPEGFEMKSSQPEPSEQNSYWYIGNLEPNQGGKVRIQGIIHGTENENKIVDASLGHAGADGQLAVYNMREVKTSIVSPMLVVAQVINQNNTGIINAGDILSYSIAYKNVSQVGMRNAIITAEVRGNILDFSKISVKNGAFNNATGIITWKASEVPGLANIDPGAVGEVTFSVPVKSDIAITSPNDKNLIVTSLAKIDSPDIPTPIDSNKIIGSNNLELRLASKVLLDNGGYYADSRIKNTGPIPMKVGQETTYTIHWAITNVSNDLTNTVVTASLPVGIRWTGSVYPNGAKIAYNDRTNELIWTVGDVPAGTGILTPKKEVAFQVGVTPQPNQVGGPVTLVNAASLVATDTFIGKDLKANIPLKDTQLVEDKTVGYAGGKVEQ